MGTPLAVLLVEDSESDAQLLLRNLRKADFDADLLRVETEQEMLAALSARSWDVIISDYNLPNFSADAALRLMHWAGLDLPFIVVSANIGEETAVAMMKAGAHDYVMKGNMARLAPAIKRELTEAERRAAHRASAEALRESEERWSFALEGAGYGVWDWNLQTGAVLLSRSWLKMHGYEEGELAPTIAAHRALLHPDDAQAVQDAMHAYFDGATPRYENEHRERCKDGSWIWVLDHGMVVNRDPDGNPLRLICTHVDITQRKRTEAALLELNEQLESRVEARTRELRQAMDQIIESEKLASLGVLVAGVSHELNTPIGNMVLAASTLSDKLDEISQAVSSGAMTRTAMTAAIDECRGAAIIIMRNGDRSSELIASFKRMSVDQASQRRRRFDLRTTVQDSMIALGAMTRRARVTVDLRIPAGIEMDSYPGHLEQIINNVIMNSLIHGFEGRDGGNISIDASVAGDMVELVYEDDGHGIATALHHKVFEPFYTTKLGQGGSGLGLSIVHSLVQAVFKGRVRLESDVGQGVRFYFTLPLLTPS